jgi:hypothetical protein
VEVFHRFLREDEVKSLAKPAQHAIVL